MASRLPSRSLARGLLIYEWLLSRICQWTIAFCQFWVNIITGITTSTEILEGNIIIILDIFEIKIATRRRDIYFPPICRARLVQFHVVEKPELTRKVRKQSLLLALNFKAIPTTEIKFSIKENKNEVTVLKMCEVLTSVWFFPWCNRFRSPHFQAGIGNSCSSDKNSPQKVFRLFSFRCFVFKRQLCYADVDTFVNCCSHY